MRWAAFVCCTLVLSFQFVACGTDDETPLTPVFDVPTVPDEGVVNDVVDGGPAEVEEEVQEEVVEEEVTEEVIEELPPGVECITATDCVGKLDPTDCSQNSVACCTEACVNSECRYDAIEFCCQTVQDCSGMFDIGKCDQVVCNTGTSQCELAQKLNCCEEDSDCTSEGETCCNTSYCGNDSTCHQTVFQNCCVEDSDCDDGNDATTDVCEAACQDGGCKYLAPEWEGDKIFVNRNFDDGSLQAMNVFDSVLGDNVGIQTVKSTSVSPSWSAYFGDPDCKGYYNGPMENCEPTTWNAAGSTNLQLSLSTQQFSLDAEAGAFLSFWVKMSLEPASSSINAGELEILSTDYLVVKIDDGTTTTTVWKSTDPDALGQPNTTNGAWSFQVANVSSWANKSIKVIFLLVADETVNWNYITPDAEPWRGVYLDNIRVQATGASSYCDAENPDCTDDQNGCTSQECSLFSDSGGGVCAGQTTTPGKECDGCTGPGKESECGADPCFEYACVEGICHADLKLECCAPSSTFPEYTSPPEVSYEGFESGLGSDYQISDPYEDNVGWQVSPIVPPADSFNPGGSVLYFGDPSTQTYHACPEDQSAQTPGWQCLPGNPVNPSKATIWTPYFNVGDDLFRKPVAAFWLWMSTEYDSIKNTPASTVDCTEELTDRLTIWVEDADGGNPTEAWNSCEAVENSTQASNTDGWSHEGADLSLFAGSMVRLGFEFDSDDPAGTAVSNQFGGVRIDDLTVTAICGLDSCVASSDCDDSNLCTSDLCDLGECSNTQGNAQCCLEDTDCNDGNECTADTCETNLCTSAYKENEISFCCSEGPWIDEWTEDFEDGLGKFVAASGTGSVVWHTTDSESASGTYSANFTDPLQSTYGHPNGPSAGQLISSPILVPPFQQGNPYAEFKLLLTTEWDEQDKSSFNELFPTDTLRVYVAEASTNFIIEEMQWVSFFTSNTTDGLWINTRVDLDEYRGEEVKLIFEFDSYDKSFNNFPGPFIDDVGFGTTCKPKSAVQCLYGGNCDPPSDASGFPDECKFASCSQDFKCLAVPVDTPECCEPYVVPDLADGFEGDTDTCYLCDPDTDATCVADWVGTCSKTLPGGPLPAVSCTTDSDCSDWTFESCVGGGGIAPFDENSVWQFADSTGAADTAPKEGSQLLYFGNGSNYGGNTEGEGFGSCGVATGPPVTLADDVPWSLEMWLQMDIEPTPDCIPDCGANCFAVDDLTIYAVDEATGIQVPLWSKLDTGCEDYSKWIHPETKGTNGDPPPFPGGIDLSDWAGKTFRLRFSFNTYDYGLNGWENDGKGVLVDKLEFVQGCQE